MTSAPSRYIANKPRPPLDAVKLRYKMQNQAARLCLNHRVAHCCRTIQKRDSPIQIRKRFDVGDDGVARYSFYGLQTCGSVHICPYCSSRIAIVRQLEVETAIKNAWDSGLVPIFLTLTHSHNLNQSLEFSKKGLLGVDVISSKTGKVTKRGGAFSRFTKSKAWKALSPSGYIRRIEITHGMNGWHMHSHWIVFLDPKKGELLYDEYRLFNAWRNSCVNSGLGEPTLKNGIDIQIIDKNSKAMGQYVTKMSTWNMADEITKSHLKKGKGRKSRSPFQILDDSFNDSRSANLFKEYADTTKGMRSMVWSKGLKNKFKIAEVSDKKAAEERSKVEDVVYVFDDEVDFINEDNREEIIKGVQKFYMVLGRGSRFQCLKIAKDKGGVAVNDYVWSLIDSFREDSLDDSNMIRPLPLLPPVKIRDDS